TRYINTQRTILVRDTARSKINSSVSRIATTAVSQPEGGRRDIQVIDPSDSIASITHICNDQRIAAKKVANTVIEYPARACLTRPASRKLPSRPLSRSTSVCRLNTPTLSIL